MAGAHHFHSGSVPWPFEGSAARGELIAWKLHFDPGIKPGKTYRIRRTIPRRATGDGSEWLFHGKPVKLIAIQPAEYCYRLMFDLPRDETTDEHNIRSSCVYTDSATPAALALTLVPTESARRRMHMMVLVGLDPELAAHRGLGVKAIMRLVRHRCRRCKEKNLCDRWLAGRPATPEQADQLVADNRFCPNAWTFRMLEKIID